MSKTVLDRDLIAYAKSSRKASGRTRADAAREMGVSQTSIFHAEETPSESLFKLRKRIIEKYSPYQVVGPFFRLERK